MIIRAILDNLADMKGYELLVTMALVKMTHGQGQVSARATFDDLMEATGSSRSAVSNGVKAVIDRKLFERHPGSVWVSKFELSTSYPQAEIVRKADYFSMENGLNGENGAIVDSMENGLNSMESRLNSMENGLNENGLVRKADYFSMENGLNGPRNTTTITTTTNNNNNKVVAVSALAKENLSVLADVGINGRKRKSIASKPHVTPDYIRAIVHDTIDRREKDLPLAIHRMERGDRMPNLDNCTCSVEWCRERRANRQIKALENQVPDRLKNIIKR